MKKIFEEKGKKANYTKFVLPGEAKQTAWKERSPRKDVDYCADLKDKYEEFINRNEFLTILEALDAVNTRTISLLTTDIKSWK